MLITCLTLLLLQTEGATVRSMTFSATDEKGAPVQGLGRDDVAVVENGVARELTSLEPDRRPLTVALVLDTSQPVASSFRLHVLAAVTDFLKKLPEGSRYAVWTTGDRPTKLVDYTSDPQEAPRALRRAFLDGGNRLLDALMEVAKDIKKQQEGSRTAVVVVTGSGLGFADSDRKRVVDEASKSGAVFMGVIFDEGGGPQGGPGGDPDVVGRVDYDFVLDGLASRSGGLRETTISAMGVATGLQKIAGDLNGRYRLSYATVPEAKERKLEVKVARPGVKIRISPATP